MSSYRFCSMTRDGHFTGVRNFNLVNALAAMASAEERPSSAYAIDFFERGGASPMSNPRKRNLQQVRS